MPRHNNNAMRRFITIGLIVLACFAILVLANDLRERISFYRAMENPDEIIAERERNHSSGEGVITLAELNRDRDRYAVIDIREGEEFAQGHVKKALSMRMGDILSDRVLQEDIRARGREKTIVFFCHDGERSRLIADFFEKNHNIHALVVRDGFKELRRDEPLAQALWEGTLRYVLPYDFWKDLRTRAHKLERISETGLTIDVSDVSHEEGARHTPIMRMSSAAVEELLGSIGTQSFSVICDSRVSCFYAKLLGYRAEQRGGRFEGYYLWTDKSG